MAAPAGDTGAAGPGVLLIPWRRHELPSRRCPGLLDYLSSFDRLHYADGSSVFVKLIDMRQAYRDGNPFFAAGFYCVPPCDDLFLFAVYILHHDDGNYAVVPGSMTPQVIWAANRGRPVRKDATLSLTIDGGLVLRDADGSLVWSADSSGKVVAGLSITRSGNLVLLDGNNMSVWQSFDRPTDCLLPGQILSEGMRLTPNAAANNWTISNQLYITVLADGLYGFAESSPPQLYYYTD